MNTIDAAMLRKMFLTGAKNLDLKKDWINELNVFPVPDGDTGTNMTLTIMSAAKAVHEISDGSIDDYAKAISSGSLRGARGNSGVILSQLLRGFTKTIRDHEELDAGLISAGMNRAVETAYKAVMKPREGTILTVAKGMAVKAEELAPEAADLAGFFAEIVAEGNAVLKRTPEMLPVLKEAGVVDSGGQGLMAVIEGAVDAFNGKELDLSFEAPESEKAKEDKTAAGERKEISTDQIKYGYCTEFIIDLSKPFSKEDERKLSSYLTSIGDSLVLVADDDMVKVHVHTDHPGLAFEKGLKYGSLTRMKVDNMREEHEEKIFKESRKAKETEEAVQDGPRKAVGFISVTIGDGMSEIFKGLGVDYLIEGGQTMNPSTEDMLEAIRRVHAETVFILPNNKNVILAANQTQNLTTDCKVLVVPTKTVPQGIAAMINFIPERSAEENLENMTEEIANVKTGEVTYAVRDTRIDGKEIKSGDIMGIGDAGILAVGKDIKEVTLEMLDQLVDEDTELVSIYNGQDFTEEDTEDLVARVEEKYPDIEVEAEYGGQPIYYCVLSVE
jgi:DAK2 domain fusion protein YloV